MTNAHILVVDDEPDISALLAYHLARESFRVRTASNGTEALKAMEIEPPDLVLLDLMLPGLSGLEVLSEIRRNDAWRDVPVILLTARSDEIDRVEGFRQGADDYVSKPFSPREVVLRVEAVIRRVRQVPPVRNGGKILRVGPFILDVDGMTARVDSREMDLTPTEFKLLHILMERRGRVQSRRQLLESVWEVTARIATRTVDMHVQRLRLKAGDQADWVETVRGFGYRFRLDPPPPPSE
jgi:two-component system phosphate regulon response regulator PhoB